MARFWVAEGHEDGALYIKVMKAPGSKGGEKAPVPHPPVAFWSTPLDIGVRQAQQKRGRPA
jgi:hypothetical protein